MAPIPLPLSQNLLPRLSAFSQRLAKRIPTSLPPILERRQNTAVIPSGYKVDGPAPGAVAGIVLGSVAGFLLIVVLIFYISQGNNQASGGFTISGQNEEIVRRDRSPVSKRRSRRSSRSERYDRGPSPRVRTTIVEEVRRPPPPPSMSERIVDERIVTESRRSSRPPPIRRVDGDDIVEVIEEGSSIGDPPPRRDRRRRSSGYRSVDPHKFAGGNYPQKKV